MRRGYGNIEADNYRWGVLIATWNVNSLRARLQRVTAWLTTEAPDVACLQELKCTEADFPRAALESLGYH